MTVWPFAYDDDTTIIRIDDNISELGEDSINQLRDAVFSIERTLGINPHGSVSSVATRLSTSLNPDGSIKASALTSVGLATLPITNSQVANTAGIQEAKLDLDHSTTDLYNRIIYNQTILNNTAGFLSVTNSDLITHITGGTILTDGSDARHVTSHIDLDVVLTDKYGAVRPGTTSATGLFQINADLINHENSTSNEHPASAITVDTANFDEIPKDATDVQLAFEAIDSIDRLTIGEHRQNMHSNGIPTKARSWNMTQDGYGQEIVPVTSCSTFLIDAGAVPLDDNTNGDDVISFTPVAGSPYLFDAQFSQVRVGDIIRVNYGNGISAIFIIESTRFTPGVEWFVRINGSNLFDSDIATAQINRPLFEEETHGVLACAAANGDLAGSPMGSVVVGNPRGAVALGIGFDPGKLNATHFNLYLELYPTGNPVDHVIELPAIDVTGDMGASPGAYNLDSVIGITNDALRASGYNHRFIAFSKNGEFGIMLADCANNASFAVISGEISGASLISGSCVNNVIGDADDGLDALGLGAAYSNIAGPRYIASYASAMAAANYPVKVIPSLRLRNYSVNGVRRDSFAATYKANADGYWDGYISRRTLIGLSTVEVDYTVEMLLDAAELRPGKTIVVQPAVSLSDALYNDVDYGRFIIKSVNFDLCGSVGATVITVLNGIHAAADPIADSSLPELPVRLYFGQDSVGFNAVNLVDAGGSSDTFIRHHEIFIDDNGNTFSHERLRLPHQSGAPLLNTESQASSPWVITRVSPKLRGFRTGTDFRRYVRFMVLDYDVNTGEYDGYIGCPSGTGITNFGEVVRVRKNVRAKFYDETNIDYIELMYMELGTSATAIIPPGGYGYVDCELFSALETDEEVMPIGWVNLNHYKVTYVDSEARQFGNISEKDLSDSAIKFIEAGDRYLHTNGLFRGFEYLGYDATDKSKLSFSGGTAIVNGHIVTVNNGSCRVPVVKSIPTPEMMKWAICINEEGLLEAVLVQGSGDQFFSETSFNVPNFTFDELIFTRKDLLPIYIYLSTITAGVAGTPQIFDCRRFVADESLNIPFSLSTEINTAPGSFRTLLAASVWHSYSSVRNIINVRGMVTVGSGFPPNAVLEGNNNATLNISAIISAYNVELRNLTINIAENTRINIDGCIFDNCTININSDIGILIGELNNTFNNCTINYTPQTAPVGGDYIGGGGAAIYCQAASATGKIFISDCTFASTSTTRFPFINIRVQKGYCLRNSVIQRNKFSDTTAVNYAAIAIIGVWDYSSYSPTLIDVIIRDNICADAQGIYLVGQAYFALSAYTSQPVCINCQVDGNHCGVIGYMNGSNIGNAAPVGADNEQPGSLTISKNVCGAIGACDATGAVISTAAQPSSGNVSIEGNFVSHINVHFRSSDAMVRSALKITNNVLEARTLTGYPLAFSALPHAITVSRHPYHVHDEHNIIISHNTIRDGYIDEITYTYGDGIFVGSDSPATIIGNTISGFTIMGIYSTGSCVIEGNFLSRNGRTITTYIFSGAESVVTGNWLDSTTVDGVANTDTVIASNSCVHSNKNQVVTRQLIPNRGLITNSANTEFVPWDLPIHSGFGFDYIAEITYTSDPSIGTCYWRIPLSDCIPRNVRILDVTVGIELGAASAIPIAGNVDLDLYTGDFSIFGGVLWYHATLNLNDFTAVGQNFSVALPPSVAPGTVIAELPSNIMSQPDVTLSINFVNLFLSDFTLNMSAVTIRYIY